MRTLKAGLTETERARFDLLEKKRKESKGLPEDEWDEWDSLAQLRRLEIELATPTPGCCEASRAHPAVIFSLGYGEAGKDDGRWTASVFSKLERAASTRRVEGLNSSGRWRFDWDWTETPEAKFCPYCGQKLPEMRLKEPLPPRLRAGSDGNYCGTCDERLDSCLCDPPETAYEKVRDA